MSQNNKCITLPIKGMHCRSCELLIEENLREIPRVKNVDVSHKNNEAVIHYDGNSPDLNLLKKAVVDAGYEIGQTGKLPFITSNKTEYVNLGIAFLIVIGLLLILKALGLTNINVGSDMSSPSFGLVVVIGLVAGFSTCMALVGGLSLGLSTKFAEAHPESTSAQKFIPHLYFVAGRILSYAFLGGLLGALGTIFRFSTLANGILTLIIGVVMLIMGLQLINIFPRLNNFKFTLPKGIAKALGFGQKKETYSHTQAMIIGGLTFFLPCGFTQAMQLYAVSTGNFWSGALVMGLFALGTAPGLLSIGGLTSLVKGKFKERFFQVAGVAVIFFALFNLNNGYTLASLSLESFGANNTSSENTVSDPNVTLENGVQVVHMAETGNGYTPNSFSIKKGVPVKWVIDAKEPYSCASSIMMPALNISKNLVAGENIIEFIPDSVGKLSFSCSMGMYTGVFNVYDDNASGPSVSDNSTVAPTLSRGSGSCGVRAAVASTGNGGGCGCGGGSGSCGGGAKIVPNTTDTKAVVSDNVQLIKASYTVAGDLQPNSFTVKAGQPVRFEIAAKEDGAGCMGTIQIQSLYQNVQRFEAGKTIVMEFTPQTPGSYLITCAMNVPHGTIKVE
ncbi:MAG: sulfite exporter TauE/SafE family protein [Candidatus Falkowbacteria bacterium]